MFVRQDLLIEKGQIVQMGFHLCETDAEVIDVNGKYVMPGFIDVHVHLREPGLHIRKQSPLVHWQQLEAVGHKLLLCQYTSSTRQ